jgi:hypothetical protein
MYHQQNLEIIVAVVRDAEAKHSPAPALPFLWRISLPQQLTS